MFIDSMFSFVAISHDIYTKHITALTSWNFNVNIKLDQLLCHQSVGSMELCRLSRLLIERLRIEIDDTR